MQLKETMTSEKRDKTIKKSISLQQYGDYMMCFLHVRNGAWADMLLASYQMYEYANQCVISNVICNPLAKPTIH